MIYGTVYIDITGGCNAKCPLCVTGREDFGKRLTFMSVEDFGRTLDRLLELRLVDRESAIGLHNWGEPILHPDLNGIVDQLNKRSLRGSISTNASKSTSFTVSLAGFADMTFSVPGWSQASQDKVHGLKFDRVVANMEATIANMRSTGYLGDFGLSYHVYKFNIGEMADARKWCEGHGVKFRPYYAYFNDYRAMRGFLDGASGANAHPDLATSLVTDYLPDLLASQPADYKCPQWDNILTINSKSQVMVCCVLPYSMEEAHLGSVFELSHDDVIRLKGSSKECEGCLKSGGAYWVNNSNVPESERPRLSAREAIIGLSPAFVISAAKTFKHAARKLVNRFSS
jgi:MoaA/NifB/PqqE/SkfB family radical SAM enzyme